LNASGMIATVAHPGAVRSRRSGARSSFPIRRFPSSPRRCSASIPKILREIGHNGASVQELKPPAFIGRILLLERTTKDRAAVRDIIARVKSENVNPLRARSEDRCRRIRHPCPARGAWGPPTPRQLWRIRWVIPSCSRSFAGYLA
jgi:hypothetical protein